MTDGSERFIMESDVPVEESSQEQDISVKQIMRTDTPTLDSNDSVAKVARMLVEHRVAGLPVVKDDTLIGIVTEADVVSREADVDFPTPVPILGAIFMADAGADFDDEIRRVLALTAGDLMSAPVISVRDTATLTQVATVMTEHRFYAIPVVNPEGKLSGLVTRTDIVRVIARLESADATST